MIETIKLNSSVLSTAEYNSKTLELSITFNNGKTYIYYSFPSQVWESFKSSSSKGSFFTKNIKGKYLKPVEESKKEEIKPTVIVKSVGENPTPPSFKDYINNKKREA